jgi:hypothetical protein
MKPCGEVHSQGFIEGVRMKDNVPLLIEFLFGESAPIAYQEASERLLRWSRDYDDWLA